MGRPICYKCDKEFSSEQRRDYHIKNAVCHNRGLPQSDKIKSNSSFESRFCHKKFTSNQRLQYHQNNLICIKQDKRCKFCDKTLTSMRNFRQHKCKTKKTEIEKFTAYNPNITISTMEHLLDEYRSLKWEMKDFDIEEPWHNQNYWNSLCDRCGCVRKQIGHYLCPAVCIFCGEGVSKRAMAQHKCKAKKIEMKDFHYFGHHPSEEELISLLKRRRAINRILPGFELRTKRMWSDRDYWEAVCDVCGTKRGEEHIQLCLISR